MAFSNTLVHRWNGVPSSLLHTLIIFARNWKTALMTFTGRKVYPFIIHASDLSLKYVYSLMATITLLIAKSISLIFLTITFTTFTTVLMASLIA